MSDITAFLTARLDEREKAIRDDIVWWWHDFDHIEVHTATGVVTGGEQCVAQFIDPARVLADIAAKLRILARHHGEHSISGTPTCAGCGYDYGDISLRYRLADCPELRDLASAFASHPDYDPAWRLT